VILRFTPVALAELDEALTVLSTNAPKAARGLKLRLDALARLITHHPYAGRATDIENLRRIPVTPYPFILYNRPLADAILVIAIRHVARDPASMPDG
jgi:plasmid stabilization system protein ParE